MSNTELGTLSTQSYKGVRDFYPQDEFIQRYIFDTWREVSERFGYQAYHASILEPVDLYFVKSSTEIVNEQTYQLTDRGGREVVLRPEMTPTVARMVAGRARDLGYPLRLYSIPNLFRYERPQRGRLREHWQLNCDLFGDDTLSADIEVIQLAVKIMESFGIDQDKFQVRISSRALLERYFDKYNLLTEQRQEAVKLIDRWHKDETARAELEELLQSSFDLEPDAEINNLLSRLENLGIKNAVFDRTIARGFDYYTGIVFEIYDLHPDNNRSVFGGGRYDNLVKAFGNSSIPVAGFGLGDVIMRDILETYDLLPEYEPASELCIIANGTEVIEEVERLVQQIRDQGLRVETDFTMRKIADAIKHADKRQTPFIVVIGTDEIKSKKLTIKHLVSGKELTSTIDEVGEVVADFLFDL